MSPLYQPPHKIKIIEPLKKICEAFNLELNVLYSNKSELNKLQGHIASLHTTYRDKKNVFATASKVNNNNKRIGKVDTADSNKRMRIEYLLN